MINQLGFRQDDNSKAMNQGQTRHDKQTPPEDTQSLDNYDVFDEEGAQIGSVELHINAKYAHMPDTLEINGFMYNIEV
jgi:hypothetical protein